MRGGHKERGLLQLGHFYCSHRVENEPGLLQQGRFYFSLSSTIRKNRDVPGSSVPRLDAVIPKVLQQVETQQRTLFEIQRGWGKLVGKPLAAHTKPVSLRRGRLIVHADRPGDNFALSYRRAQLLEALRDRTKGKVEEIVIRPGDV